MNIPSLYFIGTDGRCLHGQDLSRSFVFLHRCCRWILLKLKQLLLWGTAELFSCLTHQSNVTLCRLCSKASVRQVYITLLTEGVEWGSYNLNIIGVHSRKTCNCHCCDSITRLLTLSLSLSLAPSSWTTFNKQSPCHGKFSAGWGGGGGKMKTKT
jgi:hypothetical protein